MPSNIGSHHLGKYRVHSYNLCPVLPFSEVAAHSTSRRGVDIRSSLLLCQSHIGCSPLAITFTDNSMTHQEEHESRLIYDRRRRRNSARSNHQSASLATNEERPQIILESQRGTRRKSIKKCCDECKQLPLPNQYLMHYAKSNIGPVSICGYCLATVQDRSWKKIDIFPSALQGGGCSPR